MIQFLLQEAAHVHMKTSHVYMYTRVLKCMSCISTHEHIRRACIKTANGGGSHPVDGRGQMGRSDEGSGSGLARIQSCQTHRVPCRERRLYLYTCICVRVSMYMYVLGMQL